TARSSPKLINRRCWPKTSPGANRRRGSAPSTWSSTRPTGRCGTGASTTSSTPFDTGLRQAETDGLALGQPTFLTPEEENDLNLDADARATKILARTGIATTGPMPLAGT
ncbi:MAG: hypothetical protein QOK20_3079, partial [Acidimicrobiaceae bacterium]|nr:hypothetical protein [Acidimicrobiaceae bacterium]